MSTCLNFANHLHLLWSDIHLNVTLEAVSFFWIIEKRGNPMLLLHGVLPRVPKGVINIPKPRAEMPAAFQAYQDTAILRPALTGLLLAPATLTRPCVLG
uniref:Uncharacterized protein n=1 Tax=Arundo donax TaxID=35708 RepID=A0A0A8XU85_ARUDO